MSRQISAADEQAQLGEHSATHQPREHSSGVVILSFVTVLCGLFGFGSLVAGGPVFLSIVFIPLAIGAGWWAVEAGRKAANKDRVRLDLYEHGMTFIDHRGKLSVFRWDSMEVKQSILKQKADFGIVSETSFSYRIMGDDGTSATVSGSHDGDTDVDSWGSAIQHAVTNAQLPGALARFRRGETLRFGALSISWDSLAVKDKVTPCAHIETAYMANGNLHIRERGSRRGKLLTQINQVPNFYVFYALLELRLRSGA
ncbi:DUF6585 family protein [Amycolatopsis sp. CA-230715]|uniref:DUF6585 family protein n=1 Tax=Amycolatopsis sp. CA-230715 TaxID=2745196 RepID=UPI001C0218AB|nr:DUF6585 family protein [Amycolatopsis sp. CA-230715]QWF84133.1 hypothetical protein HUW46_07577 [Amycolatopsis sp. CA-230715]